MSGDQLTPEDHGGGDRIAARNEGNVMGNGLEIARQQAVEVAAAVQADDLVTAAKIVEGVPWEARTYIVAVLARWAVEHLEGALGSTWLDDMRGAFLDEGLTRWDDVEPGDGRDGEPEP